MSAARRRDDAVIAVAVLFLMLAGVFALAVAVLLTTGNARLYPGAVVEGKVTR